MSCYVPLVVVALKRGIGVLTLIIPSSAAISCNLHLRISSNSMPLRSFSPAMAASHPHLFQSSVTDESEIRKLVANHFLLDRVVLQWCPVAGEDFLTPNTTEIVVFSSFFERRFGLHVCNFLRGLLDHYQIEIVHVNPNSIL
jgi:hypothetical protein